MAETRVDITELRALISDLRLLDRKAGTKIARAMKQASQFVLQDAKSNASWSRRIPGAIKLSATQRAISLKVGGSRAPHGTLFEAGGTQGAGSFAHPLFGKRGHWYRQKTRPFMLPARDKNVDLLAQALVDAIADTIGGK